MSDVTKFDLKKFLVPIWDGKISYAEAAFVREAEDGEVKPIKLLYPIEEIISVRSAERMILVSESTNNIPEIAASSIIRTATLTITTSKD